MASLSADDLVPRNRGGIRLCSLYLAGTDTPLILPDAAMLLPDGSVSDSENVSGHALFLL